MQIAIDVQLTHCLYTVHAKPEWIEMAEKWQSESEVRFASY